MSLVCMLIGLLAGLFLCSYSARAQQDQAEKPVARDLNQISRRAEFESRLEYKKVIHQGNRRRALVLIGFSAEEL